MGLGDIDSADYVIPFIYQVNKNYNIEEIGIQHPGDKNNNAFTSYYTIQQLLLDDDIVSNKIERWGAGVLVNKPKYIDIIENVTIEVKMKNPSS